MTKLATRQICEISAGTILSTLTSDQPKHGQARAVFHHSFNSCTHPLHRPRIYVTVQTWRHKKFREIDRENLESSS